MALPRALQACFILMLVAAAATAGEFPYTATVTTDDVQVRSGPGEDYYPTAQLQAGDRVEVYRHDPGGWYAVRPPQGSFSWVPAEAVEVFENGQARIVGARVVARVGSELSDTRDVIQVRLEPGEEIQIIEAMRSRKTGQTWYRIAPPAGEFRWVFGKFLQHAAAESEGSPSEAEIDAELAEIERERERFRTTRARERRRRSSELDDEVAPHEEPDTADLAHYERERSRRGAEEALDGDVEEEVTAVAKKQPTRDIEQKPNIKAKTAARPWSPEKFQEELADLNVELSQVLTDEPTEWDFESLKDRAERVLAHAETALDRGKARVVISKIERFEELSERSRTIADLEVELDRNKRTASRVLRSGGAADTPAPNAAEAASTSAILDDSGRYDGIGKLTPVVSRQAGSPYFALLNEDGSVRCYVTPAPGINLRHYVGRRVGLNGSIGYAPELKSQHVTAQRVTLLDPTQLR
jgi:uncharacterized protein YgiM (DUF1202 family)